MWLVASKKRERADPLIKLVSGLSAEERRLLQKGIEGGDLRVKSFDHSLKFSTELVRFGYFSDPHIGAREFDWALWRKMVAYFKKVAIKTVYSPGDIVEGMSGRAGQIYDLQAIGFRAQVKLAISAIDMLKGMEVYSILGNHDLWYKDKSGVDASVGEAIQAKCPHYHHLGDWEADVVLAKGVTMKIFHANDGTAYATSYKLQKLIESLEGGKKPALILSGHYHKQLAMFSRNVWGFECGTMCGQTQWMRGKKIAAHKGFGVIELWVKPTGGIERLRHEFFPHYD